jgi:hypothetical protein
MTVDFVKHDAAGRILFCGGVPEAMIELQGQDVWVGKADPRYHYIAGGVRLDRPVNPAKLAGARLSKLPVPCVITINGTRYDCADQSADLDFTYSGTYTIGVEAFPYLDAEFTVTAP